MKNIILPNATFMGDIAQRLILILFLVPCLLVSSRPSAASGQVDAALQEPALASPTLEAHLAEISTRLETQESIPVIIRLRTPFSPLVEAEGGQRMVGQRRDIDLARARLLAEIPFRDRESVKTFRILPLLAASIDRAAMESLRNSSLVYDIQEDRINQPLLSTSTRLIGEVAAHASGDDGRGQTISVLDSGIETTHPFLQGTVAAEACFSTNDPTSRATSLCPAQQSSAIGPGVAAPCSGVVGCGHGTMVGGIIAGQGPDFSGVAPGAKLISIQIYSRFDSSLICGSNNQQCLGAFDSDIVRALEHVYSIRREHQIAAVNFSVGAGTFEQVNCDNFEPVIKQIVDLLATADIPFIVPAGNSGHVGKLNYPACLSNVISVGSTNKQDEISPFSNVINYLSLLAPGSSIRTSDIGGQYADFSGTSAAVPHVSGAWAILRQKNPTATPVEILTSLTRTGKIINARGIELPRIQVDAALRELGNIVSPYTTPINLAVSQLPSSRIRLTWVDRSRNETGFRISRRINIRDDNWRDIGVVGPDQTSFEDAVPTLKGVYEYRVTALFAGGESLPSHRINLAVNLPPLPKLVITAEALTSNRIDLTWNTDGLPGDLVDILRYDKLGNRTQFATSGLSKRFSDTTVNQGNHYLYFVRYLRVDGAESNAEPITLSTPLTDIEVVAEGGVNRLDYGLVAPNSDSDSSAVTRTIRLRNQALVPVQVELALRAPLGANPPLIGQHYRNFPYTVTNPITGLTETGQDMHRFKLESGEVRVVSIQFKRNIPLPTSLPIATLPVDLLPPVVTADFVISATDGAAVDRPVIGLIAQVEPRARLINPLDTSLPASIGFRRDGNGIEVAFSLYDPNLDASLVTYQFYDQIGRPVGRPINYYPGTSLRSSPILPGMSLTIKRRFTNLERFIDLRSVRVTVFDMDGSDTAISIPVGDLGSAQPK